VGIDREQEEERRGEERRDIGGMAKERKLRNTFININTSDVSYYIV
jgi:hypothetical protein